MLSHVNALDDVFGLSRSRDQSSAVQHPIIPLALGSPLCIASVLAQMASVQQRTCSLMLFLVVLETNKLCRVSR